MLLDKRELTGIESGKVTTLFRRWRSPRVKVGTQLRTPIGLVEIVGLVLTSYGDVTESQATAAGFDDLAAFHEWLDDRPGDLYRMEVRPAGPDPRVELRNRADLAPEEVAQLIDRLDRMDARANEPWTRQTLQLIRANPGRVSTELAEKAGQERQYFKRRVRRLKELGLTVSLEVGYRLSPRGEALLRAESAEGK